MSTVASFPSIVFFILKPVISKVKISTIIVINILLWIELHGVQLNFSSDLA